MLNKKKINRTSNKTFGIFFSIVFFIIGLWPLINSQEVRFWSISLAILFLVLALSDSKLLTPLNRAWISLGLFLGKIITPVLMAIVFFLLVTPIGLIMRLLGKDLLNLKKNNNKTYWIKKNQNINSMKNQF